MKARTKDKMFPYLMLLPSIIGLLIVVVYPIVRGFFLSFYEYTLLYARYPFIGMQNYVELFTKDNAFWGTLGNTVAFTIGNGVGSTLIAIGVALLLNRTGRLQVFMRGFVLLPWLVPSVVISTIWLWMYSPNYSPINDILLRIGLIKTRISFLGNLDFKIGVITVPFLSILVVRMWFSFSYKAVLLLAALVNIPRELYESASIDGAGPWGKFIHVTIPGIYPQLMIILTLTLINNFGYFDINYLMTRGGPLNYTNVMAVQLYNVAFEHLRLGYAAAMGVVMLLITSVIAIIYVKLVLNRDEDA
ncbi:sugar ABC transporter permease [Spirochaetia bacterium]|nr:sugar ABC transporter permease [Spirochaetia bacterium]